MYEAISLLSNATAVPLTLVLQRHCADAIRSAMCFPKESHFIWFQAQGSSGEEALGLIPEK